MAFNRWLYRGGRPNQLARLLNHGWALLHACGIAPNYMVTLEVIGRRSGHVIRFPLVLTIVQGERYLVSMLGEDTNWVRNIRAIGGQARLLHGKQEDVLLVEVEIHERPPILKAFLKHAPGARSHIAIDKEAPLARFEAIAAQYPVFRVLPRE